MIDVLPTDWSPKNTSLYFAKGANDVFPAPTPADGGRRACADDELLLLVLIILIYVGCKNDVVVNKYLNESTQSTFCWLLLPEPEVQTIFFFLCG